MNLCIDQGNSNIKVGIFDQNKLLEYFSVTQFGKSEIDKLYSKFEIKACIISNVGLENKALLNDLINKTDIFIELSHSTPVPIDNRYKTQETLGKDRLAAVVGASFLKPDTDILVIDAGTAITFDLIDNKKIYRGGNISVGLNLRLRALHEFTQKLPLVEARIDCPLLGDDTQSALFSGALQGIVFEMEGYINALKIKYPQLSTFLTGGSNFYFDTKLKSPIFVERNLVLIGLNQILEYNVYK